MHPHRPELLAVTVTILLGTLAFTLSAVVGYAWWSTQRGLTRHAQKAVWGDGGRSVPVTDIDELAVGGELGVQRLHALFDDLDSKVALSTAIPVMGKSQDFGSLYQVI